MQLLPSIECKNIHLLQIIEYSLYKTKNCSLLISFICFLHPTQCAEIKRQSIRIRNYILSFNFDVTSNV